MTRARPPSGAPSSSQPAERERARDHEGVDRLGQPPLPERQRRPVDDRLGARAAAVQPHARQRVAAVAARAVLAAREAGRRPRRRAGSCAGAAPRARPPRGQRPAPASRTPAARCGRARTRAPLRRTASATAAGRSPPPSRPAAARAGPSAVGVALQHGRRLAELGPDQPREVLDRALLAAGRAVAVVQEQDQGRSSFRRSSRPPQTATARCTRRHHAPLQPRVDVLVREPRRRVGQVALARGRGGAVVTHAHRRQVAHAAARPPDAQEQVLLLLVEEEARVEAADGVERRRATRHAAPDTQAASAGASRCR